MIYWPAGHRSSRSRSSPSNNESPRVNDAALLASVIDDASELLVCALSDWQLPVPHCPGRDGTELVRHIGQILARVAAIVGTRQQIDREDLASPPDANVELSVWYTENLAGAVEAFQTTDPDSHVDVLQPR